MGCGTRSRSAPELVAKEGAGKRPRTEDAQGKPGGIFTQRKATELTAHAGQEGRQQEGTGSRGRAEARRVVEGEVSTPTWAPTPRRPP